MSAMKQKDFIQALESIAPPEHAEAWDHIGLLVEPQKNCSIKKVLLTIDLTESVAEEAIREKVHFIVTYHPLFFGGFHALKQSNPQARATLRLVENGIGVYSPHTALDAAHGGVNDWLAGFFDGKVFAEGLARIITLKDPVSILNLGKKIKQALQLNHLQIASIERPIKTLALCAGAGIEALRGICADVYLTGEMKHHDVLAAVENGTGVILCGHTETERGYLSILRQRLLDETNKAIDLIISKVDRAPLNQI